jgi:hypothetical protein
MALSPYRAVKTKKGYARWVRHLAGVNGVYIIRTKRTPTAVPLVVYVGESHTNNLRETMQRHFQEWHGKTAGPTFDPMKHQVAFEVLPSAEAISRQNELIRRLRPTRNLLIPDEETEEQNFEELASFFDSIAAAG